MADLFSWLWLLLLAVAIRYVAGCISKRYRMDGARVPPGPNGYPWLGNALDLAFTDSTGMIQVFNGWGRKYGPIAQISLMGEKQVIISEAKIANDLFVKRGSKYSNRGAPHAVAYISNGHSPGFRQKDEGWRRQRNMMHSAISITAIKKYQTLMGDEADITLRELLKSPDCFHEEFLRYAYSVLTTSMLGFSIPSSSDPYIRENEEFTSEIMNSFRPDCFPSNVFPILRYMPRWVVPSLRLLERLRTAYSKQMWDMRRRVENTVKEGTAKDSIYKHFLLNRGDYDVTEEESVHTFQGMLDGGTRSPHNNLLTFLFLMMEYPEWQKRLQQEIDTVVGGERLPDYQDIPKLPTVRAVVKEVVRYRSLAAELGISHQLEADDTYMGYFFEKGTVFTATFASVLTDKEMYPDGEMFNPARWLEPVWPTYREPLTVYPNCRNFAAFGYGRRACPGVEFAERSLNIMVAKLIWAMDIKWPRDDTGNELRQTLEYEPVPAPRPVRFGCVLEARDVERTKIVRETAGKLNLG